VVYDLFPDLKTLWIHFDISRDWSLVGCFAALRQISLSFEDTLARHPDEDYTSEMRIALVALVDRNRFPRLELVWFADFSPYKSSWVGTEWWEEGMNKFRTMGIQLQDYRGDSLLQLVPLSCLNLDS
jgi:hypothetical protein